MNRRPAKQRPLRQALRATRRRSPLTWAALALAAAVLLVACLRTRPPLSGSIDKSPANWSANPHLALGLPTDSDPSDEVLLDERVYVASYAPRRNTPNWVAWRLEKGDLGKARRKNDFRADPLLPWNVYHVVPEDYAHSGFDRGHLCPSGDRTRDEDANSRTFVMTNIQPQVHELNAGPWEKLEAYERELAQRPGKVVYIVAGGIFGQAPQMIGHDVAVPQANYKIIAVLEQGQTPNDVTQDSEVVAVRMPNEAGVGKQSLREFVVSIDDLERETGYDFLSNLPYEVQRAVEARAAAPH